MSDCTTIPGDPAALRAAADALEQGARSAQDIPEQIRFACASALSGWDAPSAQGFAAYGSAAERCAEGLIAVGPAAVGPLRSYAAELEAAQHAFVGARREAGAAEGELDSAERGSPEEREADAALGDARRAMGAAREAALAANERAAREIEALIDSLPAAPAAPVPPATGGLYTSAAGLARPLPAPALPPPPTASQWEQMGEDLAWLWGKLTTPSPDERWLTDRVGDWVFSREDPTKEQRDAQREQGQPVTAPNTLPGYPDARSEGVRRKTPNQGGGGLRKRWEEGTGRKKKILEWDSQHGRVEKYNRRGEHLGEFDPDTAEPIKGKGKDPSRGRIEP